MFRGFFTKPYLFSFNYDYYEYDLIRIGRSNSILTSSVLTKMGINFQKQYINSIKQIAAIGNIFLFKKPFFIDFISLSNYD